MKDVDFVLDGRFLRLWLYYGMHSVRNKDLSAREKVPDCVKTIRRTRNKIGSTSTVFHARNVVLAASRHAFTNGTAKLEHRTAHRLETSREDAFTNDRKTQSVMRRASPVRVGLACHTSRDVSRPSTSGPTRAQRDWETYYRREA